MKIDVYSHAIRITEVYTERDLHACLSFCKPLIEMGFVKQGRKFVPKGMRTFASATRNRKEFGFHRNQLDNLKRHLFSNNGYSEALLPIVIHVARKEDYPVVKFDVRKMFPPRPKQVGIIEYVLDDVPSGKSDPVIKMVTLQPGGGKALRASTPVLCQSGWRRIGNLRPDDYVIGVDGLPTRVTGVYPQGKLQLYRVTFYDGRTVDACADHLWMSHYLNTSKDIRWRVRNTEELMRLLTLSKNHISVPLYIPVDTPDVDLPMDPWLLGVLIGDGCMTQDTIKLTTSDKYIVDRVRATLTFGQRLVFRSNFDYDITSPRNYSAVREELKYLDLFGCKSDTKFIPLMYLESSLQQRKELLTGLVDTDGYVGKRGTISYCTVSHQLAKDVQTLVRSIGGMARIRTKLPTYTHNGEKKTGQLAYNVYIRLPRPSDVVSLPKKLERVNDDNQYSHRLKLQITSIEKIDVDDAVCIAVDNESKLFVAQDYIVTHNTYISQYCMNELGLRTAIHFRGGYVKRWKDDLEETFNFKKGEFLIVKTAKDMVAIQQMALDGDLDNLKTVIITAGIMRGYIKDYEESNGSSRIYPIKPIDFYPKLGIGFRTVDELHQEFHNNFRVDLYTHIYRALGLSATMTSSNAFTNRMYDIAYPVTKRNDGGGYHVYIGVTSVFYHMDPDVRIKYMGAQGYSHTTFEEGIFRHKGLLKSYFKIIEQAIYSRYISCREDGQKILVFFARVEMCTAFVERLRKLYPELNVVRYATSEGDLYEDLQEADIGVSTLGSGGTAIDIPNLRCSFMSTMVDSRQANEQVLGRTRPLIGWPDVTPEFIYFGCFEIDKHLDYNRNKKKFFEGLVLYHNEVVSRHTLGLNN